jgi:hypothetical protein
MVGPLLESATYRGVWWLPEDEDHKLSGELALNRGKAELSVLGSFGHEVLSESADEHVLSATPRDVDRILGQTANGKAVTLENCPVTSFQMSSHGIPTTIYRPSAALLGARFTEGEELTFDEISLVTSDLDTWVSASGISWSHTMNDDPTLGLKAIDIHFEPPESIPIPLDEGAEARIDFSYAQSGIQPVPSKATVSQSAALHLRHPEHFTLDGVGEAVGRIRNFLSLAIGRTQTVVSITAFRDDLLLRFLAYAQAIETYDFRRREATDLPPEEHEHRLEAVLAPAPDEYRGWLEQQLKNSNTLSLRRRVRDVLAECPTVRDKVIGATSNERKVFINRFIDSRNYYTHYNPELEGRAATGAALYLLVIQLQAIIEMCLLRELHFDCEEIDSILGRVQRYVLIHHMRTQASAESSTSL